VTVWLGLLVGGLAGFGLGAILGAPYLPVRRADEEAIFKLAELKPGQTLIDLGSGDGRMLTAAAQRGLKAIGYEVNPVLYLWSVARTWRHRRLVTVKLGDYWTRSLPAADAIYVFLIKHHMARLDRKLTGELTQPTKVISYIYELPRQPRRSNRNTHLYIYP
jgi:hypothetical protein